MIIQSQFRTLFLVFDDYHSDDLIIPNGKEIVQIGGVGRFGFIVIAIGKGGNKKIAIVFNDFIRFESHPGFDYFLIAPIPDLFFAPEIPGKIIDQRVFGKSGDEGVAVMFIGRFNKGFDDFG